MKKINLSQMQISCIGIYGILAFLYLVLIAIVGFNQFVGFLIAFTLVYTTVFLMFIGEAIKHAGRPNKYTIKMWLCADEVHPDGMTYYHLTLAAPYKKMNEEGNEPVENHWFCDSGYFFSFYDKYIIPEKFRDITWNDEPVLLELSITDKDMDKSAWFTDRNLKESFQRY